MVTQNRAHLQTLVLVVFVVHLSQPVCVDSPPETEAVLGQPKQLICVSCLRREEVKTKTRVDWYYMPKTNNSQVTKIHIYKYVDRTPTDLSGPFKGRLTWNGSQDLQDLSIEIINVTYNDGGIYECHVLREYEFGIYTHSTSIIKNFTLNVKEKVPKDATAFYSEIMMYVLLVFLTFWLLVEMVYCYRKISKSDEQAQDTMY
ncbi:sodium channel regulatory subunit beta-3 isoform X1 [Mastacembelus armatus]|uniref:Sodium channel regulatory subunit beta-3 n=1 Tax=Mastacembelus armatus TaxID=205130 RepID=A0A3Q3S0M2_9TELE|nr:sodium channel subunit beta-3-like isoform X1 [Mastacembelus armatus]